VPVTETPAATSSSTRGPRTRQSPAGGYDILILDASSRQSLASVRSLGRAGLRVAMGETSEECRPPLPVLSFTSRYCARTVILPDLSADASAFAAAVVDFVREHPTRVVLPTTDGAIGALMPCRDELAELGCVLALAPQSALEIANDKDRTLEVARRLGIAYPRTKRIDSVEELPGLLAEFPFPFVLKPTSSWTHGLVTRLNPAEVINEEEATQLTEKFVIAGTGVLAQQWASGLREGVSMFVVNGEIRAACAHAAYRTSPPLGGASVLRQSIPIPDDIYASSVALVQAIGLEGVCEVEYRRDANGRPLLMEINARLAGTIENAVHSGVDFPLMIWRWATGQQVSRVEGYKTGVRTRWLHGDMRWLRDNYERVGRPDSVSRSRALWIFGSEFFRTRHIDSIDRRDMKPAMAEFRVSLATIRKHRGRQEPTATATGRGGAQRVS
jgi:predicted ATP-grasp superfamily ATP-dependent carboligase